MTKHERPSDFRRPTQPAEPTQPPCRVAELAKRFGAAEREWRALDEANIDIDDDTVTFNETMMKTLTDAAALDQPTSPIGALFQVLIISQEADALRDCVEEDKTAIVRQHMMRIDGALWGIRRFLEACFGVAAAEIGGEYMMAESVSYRSKLAAAITAAGAKPSGLRLRVAN